MKKNTVVNLVLICCFAGGILFAMIFQYYFFGGFCCGSSAALFFINQVGERQLKKASSRLEKTLRDQVLAIKSNNENYTEND